MSGSIHLGYEVGTGEPVEIPLRHTAVTGQTQESGKTTTLEGLISRSGLKAIAYVTKRGESSFHVANPIPPYFQERADWQFVQSLLEAAMSTKMDFKQPWIMRVSDGARTLEDVHANINKHLHGVKDDTPRKRRRGSDETKEHWIIKPARRGMEADIYYVLDKYFEQVMPQIQNLPYSTTLELAPGLNVMDLREYDFAVQALVVRSVTDHIREHEEGTVNIIPEAWKFAPKQRGSPVRLAAEEYVREAAAMKNFLWIDSQDLAGVADVLMRQVGVWLFGVQRAKHEIERALDHMPEGLPARRPRPADIATLGKGQFYVCYGREMYKVYVQPAWMTAAHAEAIARGEEDVDSAREILRDFDKEAKAYGASDRRAEHNPATQKRASDASHREEGKSVSVSGLQPASKTETGGRAAAPPRNAQRGDDSASRGETESEEEMNDVRLIKLLGCHDNADADEVFRAVKNLLESHDALAARLEKLEKSSAAAGSSATPLARAKEGKQIASDPAAAEDPGIIKVNAERPVLRTSIEKPEIEVRVQRREIEMDGTTVQGTIAILIAEGFFDEAKAGSAVVTELRRRGMSFGDATAYNRCNDIAAMGFLTKEGKANYRAVPGMKVNIIEEEPRRAKGASR